MNKKNIIVVVILCGLINTSPISMTGWTPKVNTTQTLPTGDNSMVSLDWNGTYKGMIPCADCEGIETWLTLNLDKTYLLKTKYKGKSESFQEKSGRFNWNSAGSTITLDGIDNAPNQYLVGEGKLFQLDMGGKRITGNLSGNYELTKVN
jgi:copper homeostasis protein (lipoprotein)